jgi:hypothetical protein
MMGRLSRIQPRAPRLAFGYYEARPRASRLDEMTALWTAAGFTDIQTRAIIVQRTFAGFDDYWSTVLGSPSAGGKLAAMTPGDLALLQSRLRARLPADAAGRITYGARANAVKGRRLS